MKQVLEFVIDGHAVPIEVETAVVRRDVPTAGFAADLTKRAEATFEEALDSIRSAAATVCARFATLDPAPAEVSVQFAIKVGANASVYIASGTAEANFNVTLRFTNQVTRDRAGS